MNWVKEFEKEFELKFFGNPNAITPEDKKIIYFENTRETEWYVKINQNKKSILVRRIEKNESQYNYRKEKDIVKFLLLNSDKWELIGLENEYNCFELEKVISNKKLDGFLFALNYEYKYS